jgi:hypothetical protein
MEQQFLMLTKDNPLAWALMPYALIRIKNFCVEHGTDLDPERIAQLVQEHFISDKPLLLVAVGFQKGRGVFAHALGAIDELTGNRFLSIMQFQHDKDIPFNNKEEVIHIFEQYKLWGLANGAKEVQIVTNTPALVKLYERYGFKLHRYQMRTTITEN